MEKTYEFPHPSLIGEHQIENAGAALVALLVSFPEISIDHLSRGLTKAKWRARLQNLGEYRDTLKNTWLDGGHNQDAGIILGKQCQKWMETDNQKIDLVLGMVNRKDPLAYLKPFAPYLHSIKTVEIPNSEISFSASELKETISKIVECPVYTSSYKEALEEVSPKNITLITGSLYLAGSILGELEQSDVQKNEWS